MIQILEASVDCSMFSFAVINTSNFIISSWKISKRAPNTSPNFKRDYLSKMDLQLTSKLQVNKSL